MILTKIIKSYNGHHRHQNILLTKYKAIYLFIPKVACTSIKKLIADTLEIPPYDPSKPDSYIHKRNFPYAKKHRIYDDYRGYFKFCFVRNPFDRLVSCYSNKISRDKDLDNEWFNKGVARIFKKYKKLFWGGMGFEDFVASVARIPDAQADSHFRSQWLATVDNNNKPLADFIGKFENLQEDFASVSQKIGFPALQLPHLLKTDRKNYRQYYTSRSIENVQQRYARDFELFQYDF